MRSLRLAASKFHFQSRLSQILSYIIGVNNVCYVEFGLGDKQEKLCG